MEFHVRMIMMGSLALALAACSGGGSGSGEGEANAGGAMNMGSDPNMTVDQPGEVDELLNLEADESADPVVENRMEQESSTNDPDTNLANGL
jgi:hypothetical protein